MMALSYLLDRSTAEKPTLGSLHTPGFVGNAPQGIQFRKTKFGSFLHRNSIHIHCTLQEILSPYAMAHLC